LIEALLRQNAAAAACFVEANSKSKNDAMVFGADDVLQILIFQYDQTRLVLLFNGD